MHDPSWFTRVSSRAPHDARCSQDWAHRRAFNARHVGAELVARAGCRLEEALGTKARHDRGEGLGNGERRSGHGLVYRLTQPFARADPADSVATASPL